MTTVLTFPSKHVRPEVMQATDQLVRLRRDFHQHPELAFQEVRTAGIVADLLEGLGLRVERGVAKTGVVSVIEGAEPGPCLLLRADMDALPVHEETGVAYASSIPGKMHACGHDGHTAILLVVAQLLVAMRSRLRGRVKLIFQPAEEGPGGAQPMIEAGVLHNPEVDAAVGLHLWSPLPVGQVGVNAGPFMAAADSFSIRIEGRGGHAAAPHECVDPIVTACQLVSAIQTLASRHVDPFHPVALSITEFHAGHASNVIPQEARLTGTMRTFDEPLRQSLRAKLERMVTELASSMGAKAELTFFEGYPPLVNDPAMTALVESVCREVLTLADPLPDSRTLGGEDMAYFLREVPGCYFFLGAGNAELHCDFAHHHPRFNVDERALPLGVELLLRVVERYLGVL